MKFGEIVLIFVEAEEVGVGEELSCIGWDFALIDEVEECVYVFVGGWVVKFCE